MSFANNGSGDLQDTVGLMSLARAFAYYLAALSVLAAGFAGASFIERSIVYFGIYFVVGIFLNRTVLRNLITYHPVYSTLDNVFYTKVRAVLIWPIFYVILLIKLAVVRAL